MNLFTDNKRSFGINIHFEEMDRGAEEVMLDKGLKKIYIYMVQT